MRSVVTTRLTIHAICRLQMLDAVILCGGLGTRLRSLLPDGYPKTLIEVNGEPFLRLLLRHLSHKGFKRAVLAAGYGRPILEDYLQTMDWDMDRVEVVTEGDKPLGTWPAVLRAAGVVDTDPFFIINGDTYCELNYQAMAQRHCLMAEAPLITVATDAAGVNAGTMVMSKEMLEIEGNMRLEDCIHEAARQHPDRVAFYPIRHRFYDLGTPDRLFEFRRYWSMRHRRGARHLGQG